jgi:hypothetical protein
MARGNPGHDGPFMLAVGLVELKRAFTPVFAGYGVNALMLFAGYAKPIACEAVSLTLLAGS